MTATGRRPDEFWLDKYGYISWSDEKARLDNFTIQLMNDPNMIGYLYVQVGPVSCKGEAQARAMRAFDYMTKTRHADRNRIVWRDIGYGDAFQVSIQGAQRGSAPMYFPDYKSASDKHVIKNCGSPLDMRARGRSD